MAGIWLTGDIVLLYTFISFVGRYMITEYSNLENHKRKPKAAQVEPVWLYKNPQNKHPNKPAKLPCQDVLNSHGQLKDS